MRRTPDHHVVHALVAASGVDWRALFGRDARRVPIRPGGAAVVTGIERPGHGMDVSSRGTLLGAKAATTTGNAIPDGDGLARAYVEHCIDEGDVASWDSFLASTDQGVARLLSRATRNKEAWSDAFLGLRKLYAEWAREESSGFVAKLFEKIERMDVDPLGRVFLRAATGIAAQGSYHEGGRMHGGDRDMVVRYQDIDFQATCRNAFASVTSGLVALKPGRKPLAVFESSADDLDLLRVYIGRMEEKAA